MMRLQKTVRNAALRFGAVVALATVTQAIQAFGELQVGMSVAEMVKRLGPPKGAMGSQAMGIFTYADLTVTVENGVVTEVKHVDAAAASRPSPVGNSDPGTAPLRRSMPGPEGDSSPDSAPDVFRKSSLYTRGAHGSALYFGPIPIEFDPAEMPDALHAEHAFTPIRSASEARDIFRKLRSVIRGHSLQMLNEHINCIYFVKDVSDARGTRLPGSIDAQGCNLVLSAPGQFDLLLAQLLVAREPRFAVGGEWHMLSAGGYVSDNAEVNPAALSQEDVRRRGFVNRACMLSPHADAAEMYAMLRREPAMLFSAAESSKMLQAKLQGVIEFDKNLHLRATGETVEMDLEYFMGLASRR